MTKKYMTKETLFHELSHSLGPGTITVNGRQTTVNAELKESIFGDRGSQGRRDGRLQHPLPDAARRVAGRRARRSCSPPISPASSARSASAPTRRTAAARPLQYSYLREKGAFAWDAAARASGSTTTRMEAGVRDLTADLVRLQGNGDYAGTKAFFDRYARLDDDAARCSARWRISRPTSSPTYPYEDLSPTCGVCQVGAGHDCSGPPDICDASISPPP